MNHSTTVDPSRWDEIGPLLDGGVLRPYGELKRMPYYAPPGFYADGDVLAFQPGWDAVHWYGPNWPTVAEVRERIASLLISSWLVQDRDDASRFFLGDEPGSIITPWGVVPARVIFARRKGLDAPWENLASVLADVDHAHANAGFIAWRLRNALHPRVKTKFHLNPDGALVVVFRIEENVIWAPTGRKGAHLPSFEQVVDLKQYLLRTAGFEYRVALADALRDAVNRRTGKKDTTVAWGTRRNIVKRKDRTVEIYGYEPMASIFLGGRAARSRRRTTASSGTRTCSPRPCRSSRSRTETATTTTTQREERDSNGRGQDRHRRAHRAHRRRPEHGRLTRVEPGPVVGRPRAHLGGPAPARERPPGQEAL